MDLQAAPIVKGIFWLLAVPAMLRGQLSRPPGPRGLVEETLGLGFGVLAEVPNREIVVGTYSQPWYQQVTFHPLPPRSSPPSPSPGTSRSRTPSGPSRSGRAGPGLVTRARVVTTDAEARRRFRRYWAPMSAGIILIRYMSLPMVKREAERRARNQHRRSDDLPERMRWRIPTRPD